MKSSGLIHINKHDIMNHLISNAIYGSTIYDKTQENLIKQLTKMLVNQNKTITTIGQELYNILGPYTEITSFLYEQIFAKVYVILFKKEMPSYVLSSLIYTINDKKNSI